MFWRLVTCLVFATIGSVGADFEHYTWWSVAWLGIYGTLEEVGLGRHYFWFIVSMQLGVIVGTNVMGGYACDVFAKAFQSLGPTKFILGNFAMHYLPSLIVVMGATPRHVYCGEPRSVPARAPCAQSVAVTWPLLIFGTRIARPAPCGKFGRPTGCF